MIHIPIVSDFWYALKHKIFSIPIKRKMREIASANSIEEKIKIALIILLKLGYSPTIKLIVMTIKFSERNQKVSELESALSSSDRYSDSGEYVGSGRGRLWESPKYKSSNSDRSMLS